MPTVVYETILAAPVARVWLIFTDPVKSLPAISPPRDAVVIESADLPVREGSVIRIAIRDLLGRRRRWESRVTVFSPPHPVVFGMEARFVDVQTAGPFAMWKHEHELEAVDDKTTRMLDRVTYKPPMGFMGFIADWVYLRWKIRGMFRYRAKALKAALEQ